MKQIIFFFALLFSVASFCQGTVKYTAGISYGVGDPMYTPQGNVSKKYINLTTLRSSTYSGATWVLDGRGIDVVSGCAAPAYTPGPGQSNIVINNCTLLQNGQGPELYVHDGTSWIFINEKSTAPIYAAGTGINIAGTVISNTLPDQVVSIAGAGINAVTGTYPNFTVTGTEVDGSTTNELQTLSVAGNDLTISDGNTVTIPTPSSTLDALTDVTITSPSNAQILQYNTATTQWVNATLAAITGTGTANRLTYWTGTSTQAAANQFYVDATNGRIGVNTTSPARALDFRDAATPTLGASFDYTGFYLHRQIDGASNAFIVKDPASTTNTLFLKYLANSHYFYGSSDTKMLTIAEGVRTNAAAVSTNAILFVRYIKTNDISTDGNTGLVIAPDPANSTTTIGVKIENGTRQPVGIAPIMAWYQGATERARITTAGQLVLGAGAPNSASIFEAKSTTGIMVPPNMTSTQRDAISSPPNGIIYNTTTGKLQVYAAGSWVDLH